MKDIVAGLTRSTLIIVAIWMTIATALSVAAVESSFYVGRVNNTRLRAAMEQITKTSFDMSMKHRSMQDIASALAAVGQKSGLSVTVFDNTGRRLVGNDNMSLFVTPRHEFVANVKFFQPPKLGPGKVETATQMPSLAPGPPGLGYMGFMTGTTPMPPSDLGPGAFAVQIPNGVALIRLTQSSATLIERAYIISMIALLALGVVLTRPLQQRYLKRQLEPLVSVESALGRLSSGDYSKIEVVGHAPGTTTIVEAYNACADRLSSALKRQAETESNMRQFVAEAGHELRTPLTVLMGFVEVLQDGAIKDDALAHRILESVAIEGQRMRALILKLLLLARLEAASPEGNEIVDVSVVAREVVNGFQALPGGDCITFSAEPGTFVNATSSEVREVVGNLLDNALKHAPGSATRARVARANGAVELCVSDDGPGMTAQFKDRAFERFTRGDDTGSVPGSGLGLAIVKRIVDRTRGTVALETAPGKGTTVLVRIPCARAENTDAAGYPDSRSAIAGFAARSV